VWKAGVAVNVNDCTLCPPESRHGADKSVFYYASSCSYIPRTIGMLRLASCIALQQRLRASCSCAATACNGANPTSRGLRLLFQPLASPKGAVPYLVFTLFFCCSARPAHVLQRTAASGTTCLRACLLLCNKSRRLDAGAVACCGLRPCQASCFSCGGSKQSWGSTRAPIAAAHQLLPSAVWSCTLHLLTVLLALFQIQFAVGCLRPASIMLQGAAAIGAHTARHAVSCTLETKASLS
jgi:hypothetical protein